MTDTPRPLTRADLPPQFTPETISTLPISVVSQLRHPCLLYTSDAADE